MNGKNEDNTLRILIIGDCKIGKTSLLLKYLLNNDNKNASADTLEQIDSNDSKLDFLYKYKPTTLSIYKCQVSINSSMYNILFTDPNGNNHDEKLADLRKNFYLYDNNVDVILLCFSLVDKVSFSNITKQWYPEIRQYFNEVPIVLIGTNYDLKQQYKQLHQLEFKSSILKQHAKNPSDTIKRLVNNGDTVADSLSTSSSDSVLNVNKTGLAVDENNNSIVTTSPVKRKDCIKLFRLINAKKYLQCSCYDDKSIYQVMNCAIKYAYNYKRDKCMNKYMMPKPLYLPFLTTTSQTKALESVSSYSNTLLSDTVATSRSNQTPLQRNQSVLKCFCCRSETCDSLNEAAKL